MKSIMALIVGIGLSLFASAATGGDDIDKKLLDGILRELDLMPSLYAASDEPIGAPKFSTAKLAAYAVGPKQTIELERNRWKTNKVAFDKNLPLRSAIFEAMEEAEGFRPRKFPMTLAASKMPLKQKADVHRDQESLATTLFKLETVLAQMEKAVQKRNQEKVKRWVADFDFAMARVQTNVVFLWEYNYMLAQVRTDRLPQLAAGQDGWKIKSRAKVSIPESKVKDLVKARAKLLQSIQDEHADTPWAHFAKIEGKREMGMEWTPKKK